MKKLILGILILAGAALAAAEQLFPPPESFNIEDVTFMRWTGGSLHDPDLTWEFVKARDFEDPAFERTPAVEVNRRTGAVRWCARYNVGNPKFDPCEGAKRLR